MKFLKLIFVMAAFLAATTYLDANEGDKKLNVCATVPELGSLINRIGGEHVAVTVFAKGSEDPHFLTAKPSFIKKLSQAELLVYVGAELETGWLPVLIKGAKNLKVKKDRPGHLDCSSAVKIRGIPAGKVDRSHGHVHANGNPHYLLDPINGLKVAKKIKEKLVQLVPSKANEFEKNFSSFHLKLSHKMIGVKLTDKYKKLEELEKLSLLYEHGKIEAFLKEQGEIKLLGGWFADMLPLREKKIVADHDNWLYFSECFNFKVSLFLEPKPGIAPSTRHLKSVIKKMKQDNIDIIIQSTYFNPKYGEFVSKHTESRILKMAHQVGAVKSAEDYISMIDHNVSTLVKAVK